MTNNILDESIHDISINIGRLQEQRKKLNDWEDELNEWGLEGVCCKIDEMEYEYWADKRHMYFDIYKRSYTRGW